jgi:hypothetical protein
MEYGSKVVFRAGNCLRGENVFCLPFRYTSVTRSRAALSEDFRCFN